MSDTVIVLERIPTDLKTCQPQLMPFHISYSGPAAISTYMSFKPAKVDVVVPSQISPSNGKGVDDAGAPSARAMSVDEDSKPVDGEAEDQSKEGMHATMVENPLPTPVAEASTERAALPTQAPEPVSSTRNVSTFRGRTIQSFQADLPTGYRGLVLQAPSTSTLSSSSSSPPTTTNSKSKETTSRPELDPTEQPTTTRRRGRLTRSAVSTRVIDVEKEEAKKAKEALAAATVDADNLMDVDETPAEQESNAPQRRLKAVSQFSSFTLWHADHPVVEYQDEYYRSVHEWTALAALVHQDEEEEASVQ